jgi:hypothetical protein
MAGRKTGEEVWELEEDEDAGLTGREYNRAQVFFRSLGYSIFLLEVEDIRFDLGVA